MSQVVLLLYDLSIQCVALFMISSPFAQNLEESPFFKQSIFPKHQRQKKAILQYPPEFEILKTVGLKLHA